MSHSLDTPVRICLPKEVEVIASGFKGEMLTSLLSTLYLSIRVNGDENDVLRCWSIGLALDCLSPAPFVANSDSGVKSRNEGPAFTPRRNRLQIDFI